MHRLVSGEYRKLSTTWLWAWLLLAAVALTALYASLNIAFSGDPDNFAPHPSTAEGQRLLFGIAANPATTLVGILAAIGIAGEFRHRTATATFLATPHRRRVIGAKLLTFAVVGLGYAVVCLTVVAGIAVPWLATMDIGLSLTGGGVPGTLAGVVLAVVAFALIGVALGTLLREQVATVVGLLVYRFVAEPIVTSMPALHDWTRYLPGPATSGLVGSSLDNQEFLEPWQGGLVLAAYVVVLVTAAVFIALRRDIT